MSAGVTGGWRGRRATIAVGLLGVALAAPEWVPHAWSREDGPIEWTSFACFLVGGLCALAAARHLRGSRRAVLLAAGFGVVLLVAAGEEISWGQRVLEVDTPAALVDGNRQDELNLHNLEELQGKAVIAQLAVAALGVALPSIAGRRRWAHIGFPCFAGYLAYRAARAVAAVAGLGPAGRNSEAAELVLAAGLLAVAWQLRLEVGRARGTSGQAGTGTRSMARPMRSTKLSQ